MKKMKSLAHLKNPSVGSIHHMEIHPAKNSKGGQAFTTKIVRNPSPAAEAAMAKGGPYMPPPTPEEVQHPDGQDMVDHVGSTFGVQPEDDGDADDGQ